MYSGTAHYIVARTNSLGHLQEYCLLCKSFVVVETDADNAAKDQHIKGA